MERKLREVAESKKEVHASLMQRVAARSKSVWKH
jgi:hypothetical protein